MQIVSVDPWADGGMHRQTNTTVPYLYRAANVNPRHETNAAAPVPLSIVPQHVEFYGTVEHVTRTVCLVRSI